MITHLLQVGVHTTSGPVGRVLPEASRAGPGPVRRVVQGAGGAAVIHTHNDERGQSAGVDEGGSRLCGSPGAAREGEPVIKEVLTVIQVQDRPALG